MEYLKLVLYLKMDHIIRNYISIYSNFSIIPLYVW